MPEFSYELIWMIIFIVFLVMESMGPALITIWFAAGALVAFGASLLHLSFLVQCILFFIVSIILLIFTRPFLKKYFYENRDKTRTNVNSVIGKKAIVTKPISEHNFGEVRVDGNLWTAASSDLSDISEGDEVEILSVSGVKLMVKRLS